MSLERLISSRLSALSTGSFLLSLPGTGIDLPFSDAAALPPQRARGRRLHPSAIPHKRTAQRNDHALRPAGAKVSHETTGRTRLTVRLASLPAHGLLTLFACAGLRSKGFDSFGKGSPGSAPGKQDSLVPHPCSFTLRIGASCSAPISRLRTAGEMPLPCVALYLAQHCPPASRPS